MIPLWLTNLQKLEKQIIANLNTSPEQVVEISQALVKKSAESAEKSAESSDYDFVDLSVRQKQILECMKLGSEYSTKEVAIRIGLKGPRTRQLLNELVAMGFVSCTAATKNRRYVKIQ